MNDYTKRIVWILSGLFVLGMILFGMSGTGRRVVSALMRPFSVACSQVLQRVEGFSGERTQEGENVQVKEALLSDLLSRQSRLQEVMAENRQLRKMLEIAPPVGWRALRAEVLLRDPVTWNWEFQISKGTQDGVGVGNPVLLDDCLIGRIVEVCHRSARVVTIASPHCKCSVFVTSDGGEELPGVFCGQGGSNGNEPPICQVDYLPKQSSIQQGSQVMTSGLGTELPYGIPVGRVSTYANGETVQLVDNARSRVRVRPLADFRRIYFVTILVPECEKTDTKKE